MKKQARKILYVFCALLLVAPIAQAMYSIDSIQNRDKMEGRWGLYDDLDITGTFVGKYVENSMSGFAIYDNGKYQFELDIADSGKVSGTLYYNGIGYDVIGEFHGFRQNFFIVWTLHSVVKDDIPPGQYEGWMAGRII